MSCRTLTSKPNTSKDNLRVVVHSRLILFGVASLITLGVFSGIYPVRLQRNDLDSTALFAGSIYILLAIAGAIALALRAVFQKHVIHVAVDSTLTMTAMIFATILAAGVFSLVFIGLGGKEREVTTGQIYAGVMPFIGLQIIGIMIVWIFPSVSTWFPRVLF